MSETSIPERIAIGDLYGPAMEMREAAEAEAYLEKLVARQVKWFKRKRDEAERIERMNLGYYAGYYDAETRERIERLFKCAHPYFGAIAVNGQPTPETAFNIGNAIGGAMKKGYRPAPRGHAETKGGRR